MGRLIPIRLLMAANLMDGLLNTHQDSRWRRYGLADRSPQMQAIRVVVDVFFLCRVVLNHHIIRIPKHGLYVAHFTPSGASIQQADRNMFPSVLIGCDAPKHLALVRDHEGSVIADAIWRTVWPSLQAMFFWNVKAHSATHQKAEYADPANTPIAAPANTALTMTCATIERISAIVFITRNLHLPHNNPAKSSLLIYCANRPCIGRNMPGPCR